MQWCRVDLLNSRTIQTIDASLSPPPLHPPNTIISLISRIMMIVIKVVPSRKFYNFFENDRNPQTAVTNPPFKSTFVFPYPSFVQWFCFFVCFQNYLFLNLISILTLINFWKRYLSNRNLRAATNRPLKSTFFCPIHILPWFCLFVCFQNY